MKEKDLSTSFVKKCVPPHRKMSSVLFFIFLHCLIYLIFIPHGEVLGARSTDELDGGYVVREETSHVVYHRYSHSENSSGQIKPFSLTNATTTTTSIMTTTTTTPTNPDRQVNTINQKQASYTMQDIKFWGCYKVWSNENPPKLSVNINDTIILDIHPDVCVTTCKTMYNNDYDLALIKGLMCVCTHWVLFNKTRISDNYCNFECRGNNFKGLFPDIMYCGGNLAYSVYCLKTDTSCLKENNQSVGTIDIELHAASDPSMGAVSDDTEHLIIDIADRSLEACASCDSEVGGLPCLKPDFTPRQDYFPMNSPLACIQNCRRHLIDHTTGDGHNYPIAVLGWMKAGNNTSANLPICLCYEENPLANTTLPHMFPIPQNQCQTHCPGNDNVYCGNYSRQDYFTVYCAIRGSVCGLEYEEPSLESTLNTDMTGSPESPEGNSTITTQNTTTFTVPPTTTSPTNTSTTLPATTPPPSSCDPQCKATDMHGFLWITCPGQTLRYNCSLLFPNGDKVGIAKWTCLTTGSWETDIPDYSGCHTVWYGDMWEKVNETLSKNGTFPMEDATDMLSEMETKCKVTDTNKVPYYGRKQFSVFEYMKYISLGKSARANQSGHFRWLMAAWSKF